jgi:hypothetical protein
VKRVLLLAGALLFFAAAVITVLIAPDRWQWVIYVRSGGANEVMLPIGYWAAAAIWGWASGRLLAIAPARVAGRVIVTGFVLHMVLLLVVFARDLGDPSMFSTTFYRVYAKLFCATALAILMAAAASWVGRGRLRATDEYLLDLPVWLGAGVLAAALVRADPRTAAVGVALGAVLAVVWVAASAGGHSSAEMWRGARAVLFDERVFLVLVFLAACALRLLYTRRVMTDPNYVATGGDGPTYDALAWSIAQGHGVPESFRNGYPLLLLGYVWFVGLVYAVFGHSYFVLCAIQSLLGATVCVLTYAIASTLFGTAAARVAAVFTAFSFLLIFSAAAIGHQAIDVFLTVLIAWLLVKTIANPRVAWTRWAGIGVLVGCAIAVRETNAFLLAFVTVWIGWVLAPRVGRAGSMRAVVALLAAVMVVLAPLAAPMVSSSGGRLRLRQHFDRLFKGWGDDVRTRKDLVGPLEEPSAALTQLRTSPRFVLGTIGRAVAHNFALQFFTQPYGGFDLVTLAKGSRYYYGLWFYAYALTCAGILAGIRRIRRADAQAAGLMLVFGILVSRTLPHLILESHFRHRAPIEPFLIMLAAAGAVQVWTLAQPDTPRSA